LPSMLAVALVAAMLRVGVTGTVGLVLVELALVDEPVVGLEVLALLDPEVGLVVVVVLPLELLVLVELVVVVAAVA